MQQWPWQFATPLYAQQRDSQGRVFSVRAMKQSAGTLLYRGPIDHLEVLLVHPSGNYNQRAPWSIPKGEPEEEADLEQTARRETFEETGLEAGTLVPPGFTGYRKSRKRVHCFAGPAPTDAVAHCASWEVDQARFVSLSEARSLIHVDQLPFIERLMEHLRSARDDRH